MAIFHELDTSMYDGVVILENADYIAKNINLPRNVPVVEANDNYIAKFSDVSILAEDYDISYLDALVTIAESNDVDPDSILVAIDEADIICYPELVDEFTVGNNNLVVVNPISENCLAYKTCKLLVEAYEATLDENYLLAIIDEAEFGSGGFTELVQKAREQQNKDNYTAYKQAVQKGDNTAAKELKKRLANAGNIPNQNIDDIESKMNKYNKSWGHRKDVAVTKAKNAGKAVGNFAKNNKGKLAIGAGLAAVAGGALALKKFKDNQEMKQLAEIQKQMTNAPKSWIAKKIASLRKLYKNYMHKAQLAKATGQAGVFTKVAHKILSVIDALMKKMQNIAG